MPFEITAETLLGLGTFIGAVVAAVISYRTSKKAARKDELDSLREEFASQQKRISNLTDQVDLWQKRYSSLFNYVLLLRTIMVNNNLEIPLLDIEDDTEQDGDIANATKDMKNLSTTKMPIKKKPRIPGAVAPEHMPKPSDGMNRNKPEESEDE